MEVHHFDVTAMRIVIYCICQSTRLIELTVQSSLEKWLQFLGGEGMKELVLLLCHEIDTTTQNTDS